MSIIIPHKLIYSYYEVQAIREEYETRFQWQKDIEGLLSIFMSIQTAIEEASNWGVGRPSQLRERLIVLSRKLSDAALNYKNFCVSLGISPSHEALIALTMRTSDLQDAIATAIAGDGGEQLRQMFPNSAIGREGYQVDLGGRPSSGGMLLGTAYIARQAMSIKERNSKKRWVEIGEDIWHELQKVAQSELSGEQYEAYQMLVDFFRPSPTDNGSCYMTDPSGLRKLVSNAVHRWKKNMPMSQ